MATETKHPDSRNRLLRRQASPTGAPTLIWVAPGLTPGDVRPGRLDKLRNLGGAIVRPVGLEECSDGAQLVMAAPPGDPLDRLIGRSGLRIGLFLTIATRLTEAVQSLHSHRIAHGHLAPQAIFVDPATRQTHLALHPEALTRPAARPSGIENRDIDQLLYCAPEQSGRTADTADLRADLYALGVIFYEMLSGTAPFRGIDELELIHHHLAIAPQPLTDLRPDLPEMLVRIVDRLLRKSPADRYQSAYGLLADLRRCAAAFDEDGEIPAFDLGARDALSAFEIPDRLYGRETEMRHLRESLADVRNGAVRVVLLSGRSGTGKSALALTLRDQQSGEAAPIFISGKYEEVQSLPYLALLDALRELVLQKLALGGDRLAQFRAAVLERLGDNFALLTEYLPELRHLSPGPDGPAPPNGPEMDPLERNQQFRIAMQALFETMADAHSPVILFIDDLQWADSASIALLEDLFQAAHLSHLLLIAAYRDNAPGAVERADHLVGVLHQAGIASQRIPVRLLDAEDTRRMVADSMHLSDPSQVDALARAIHAKTQGNAFYLRRLLGALYQEGAIRFDIEAESWRWQMDALTRRVVDTDVARLMAERFDRLSPPARDCLRYAACLGSQFSTDMLRIIFRAEPQQIEKHLNEAVQEGFIAQQSAPSTELYGFSHDMVREAAYRGTPEADRPALHYHIGKRLAAEIEEPETDERVFIALDQLIAGMAHLREPPVGRRIVQLVLAAVTRAKSVAAYDTAKRYLEAVEGLPFSMGGADWENEPAVTAALRREMMEVAFMHSGYDAAQPYFEELQARLPHDRDRAHIHQVLVTLFTFRSDYDRALEYGIRGLRLLDVNLNPPLGPKILNQLLRTGIEARRHDLTDMSDLPELRNERSKQLIEMLMIVATPAFLKNKDLFVLISLRMFRITLRDGLTSAGVFSIQTYAIVLYLTFGAVERAYRIGTNLIPLLERRQVTPQVRGRHFYTYCVVVAWHFRSYEVLHDLLRDSIRYSWTAADLEYVGYFYYGMLKYSWVGQVPLSELTAELDEFDRFRKRLNHEVLNNIIDIYRRAVARLTGPAPDRLLDDSDRALGQRMVGEASVGSYLTTELLLAHVFADWPAAAELYPRLRAEESFATLGPEFVDFHLLSGLTLTRVPAPLLGLSPRLRRKRLRRHLAALRRLAERFPVNHGFQHDLLRAEVARHAGRPAPALYDEAIRKAEAAQRWCAVGIACECAAQDAAAQGDIARRDALLHRARTAYATWEATGKVAQMEAEWPGILLPAARKAAPAAKGAEVSVRRGDLDLDTILKTSQAIFEITDLDRLLRRLLEIGMENAGANLGALYLQRDAGLELVAEGRIEGEELRAHLLDRSLPAADLAADRYPKTIVSRVALTRQAVILTDARTAPDHSRDAHVQQSAPRSLMCLPIVGSGALQGVLHLENTLSPGTFTADRQALLTTIMALAAISLSNATLYARQEQSLALEKRARRELDRVNRLKDAFLANTSHELRTPLNGIIGLADSMIDGAHGPLNSAVTSTLGLISSSGRRLSNLVNDILDFSQLREGEITLDRKAVDLHSAIDLVFTLLGPRAESAGMRLTNAVPEGTMLDADEDRLQQILVNLVDNGVKFAPQGDLTITAERRGKRVEIRVADTGPGIARNRRDSIFQSFEQVDASIRRSQGGVGLGLAITRRLVELHGGTIAVTSERGKGAVFVIDMPAATGAALSPPPESARSQAPVGSALIETTPLDTAQVTSAGPSPPALPPQPARPLPGRTSLRRYKVLVVDDDPVNLQVLHNYMTLEGFAVELAQNGTEALRRVAEGYDPDIVLLDVMMPRMSGYEVCARLRETHPAARLPIVMLTAKNRVEDLRAGFAAGATDYLTKPFSRDELLARMHTHIELARVSSAYERFVPVEFLEFLNRDSILEIGRGDSVERRMSVMFTDIRRFTTLAEGMSPAQTFDFLNDYIARMGPIIQENRGVVNHYLGDGMMALFPGRPHDAVRAAIGIQQEMRRFNVDRAAQGAAPVATGIGLHTGDLIMGILGDRYRLNGNVVSDTVNIAARLETLTAQSGIGIAASAAVVADLPDELSRESRPLTRVQVVGKSQAIDVHEIFSGEDGPTIAAKQASRDAFTAAQLQFRAGDFAQARATFEAISAESPNDHAARWLATRAATLARTGAPEGWAGVDVLTRK